MRIIAAIGLILVVCIGIFLYTGKQRAKRTRAETQKLVANCERGGNDEHFARKIGNAKYRNADYDKLVSRYRELHDGMDINAVGQLLGTPSYTQALTTKDDDEFTGCDWVYVLESSGPAENRDEDLISVLIDPGGKVTNHFWKKHPGE